MVNVNTVYQTVQHISNIEQRGYLPPLTFNSLAGLAQTELFEQYFHDYNFYENAQKAGRTNSEFANLPEQFRERINLLTEKFVEIEPSGSRVQTLPSNLYRLIEINYNGLPIEEEEHDKDKYAQLSPLAKSTADRPTFVRLGDNTIEVSPTGLSNEYLQCTYIRTLNVPKWGYVEVDGEPFYASSRSTQFDIHQADEAELIIKILFYTGISIKDTDVIQAAQAAMQMDIQGEAKI